MSHVMAVEDKNSHINLQKQEEPGQRKGSKYRLFLNKNLVLIAISSEFNVSLI